MKSSRFAAKLVTRLFLLLLLFAAIPLFQVHSDKFSHLYFITSHKWVWVFPILLVGAFITLLVGCVVQKYSKPDWNWLLVVNTVVLMAYCATLYVRVLELVK